MSLDLDTSQFIHDGSRQISLTDFPNQIDDLYGGKKDYSKKIDSLREEIDEAQERMYAHDHHAMLIIFQAMDAAGKDSTIRSVMSGVNPHGVTVTPFKRPSQIELDHDFLWRTTSALPQRGRIGIFNRSYYEETLVVRVHPEIVTKYQRVPPGLIPENLEELWEQRFGSIRALESHLHLNGTTTLKFFLNISKDEQARRFIRRIDRPDKNWKFSAGDLKERACWDEYQSAYQAAINATATPESPWCIIPADDKKNMRLIVSQIIRDHIIGLETEFPSLDAEQEAELADYRAQLEGELG